MVIINDHYKAHHFSAPQFCAFQSDIIRFAFSRRSPAIPQRRDLVYIDELL